MRGHLVIGLIAVAATATLAQQPAPSFRAGIDIITLEAAVLDGDGKPISDLTIADFNVTVGGKPRRVREARFHDGGAIESIAHTDDPPLTAPVTNATDGGRIVVFVVDRDSIAPGGERAIFESATALLDGLRPADASGVLALPGSSTELTRDHARVGAALMRMTGSRPTTMMSRDYNISWDEALAYERRDQMTMARVVERECPDVRQPEGLRNPCPPELALHAIEMLQTGRARTQTVLANLSALARQLEPLRGPKQIVLLSSGFPFGQDLLPLYTQFEKQAAAAQIVFYAVHLDQPGTDVTARKTTTSAFGGAEFASGLGNVASMTGGAFFMASGTGAGIFQRVANEIHNFYELAIETDPADFAAGTLDVEVKVSRPGASVRNRRRVIAPSKTVLAGTDRLSEMLRQPVDVSEVPVALSVYTMRGDEPSTLRTLVGLDAGAAASVGPGEWGFAVFNDGNVVATGRQKLDKPGGPWTAAMAAKLLPGRYRVRAAVIDGANRAGVVERALEVGLRGSQQVQFSDLLVGVADANGRLQPSSRVMKGAPLSALVEVISADAAMLEKVRTMIEIVPGGSATPIKRFMMATQSGTLGAILTNSVEIATADLNAGPYIAIATPMIGEQPLGKVSRVFEIVSRP
jgi:VWFA-related protein